MKKRTTFTLSPENIRWLRRQVAKRTGMFEAFVSASEIVDELITEKRETEELEKALKREILHPKRVPA